jgi:putative hydrolase of the HAD superfamily
MRRSKAPRTFGSARTGPLHGSEKRKLNERGSSSASVSCGHKVIFWDFHGTLAYSPRLWSGSMKAVLDENEPDNGISVDDLAAYADGTYTWDFPDLSYTDLTDPDRWWALHEGIFERAYLENGIAPHKARAYSRMVRHQIVRPERYRLYDDTIAALRACRDAGYVNHILSNHIPELPSIASSLGLSDLIGECISSANIGYVKPNPNAFRLALIIAGEPEDAWMVGDSLKADALGATRANLRSILVRSPRGDFEGNYSGDLKGVLEIIDQAHER